MTFQYPFQIHNNSYTGPASSVGTSICVALTMANNATPTITITPSPPQLPQFTFHPSLSHFAIPPTIYIQQNPTLASLIVSAVVVHHSPSQEARVLLIQRAATDYFPLLWECPGGCVDPSDETILHAVQRELFEETGLVMIAAKVMLDDTVEFVWTDGRSRRIVFLVEVEVGSKVGKGSEEGSGKGGETRGSDGEGAGLPGVVLNPEEHADFVWASVRDVKRGFCDGRDINFSHEKTEGIVLEGMVGESG